MNLDTVGFIGGGNMTRAIAGGLLDDGFDAKKYLSQNHRPSNEKPLRRHCRASSSVQTMRKLLHAVAASSYP